MGRIVKLTVSEMAIADYVGKGREADYKNNKLRMCKKNGEYLNIIGARAEMAVCKLFNAWPDLNFGVDDYDCIIKDKKVDVKATDIRHGSMTATLNKKKSSTEVYILAYVEDDLIDILGYVTADDLINEDSIGDLGYGPIYLVRQTDPKFKKM